AGPVRPRSSAIIARRADRVGSALHLPRWRPSLLSRRNTVTRGVTMRGRGDDGDQSSHGARPARSAAAVSVVEPDNIIFAEIAAGLHLDQFERDLAGISQPVDRSDGNEDRLVLVHDLFFL